MLYVKTFCVNQGDSTQHYKLMTVDGDVLSFQPVKGWKREDSAYRWAINHDMRPYYEKPEESNYDNVPVIGGTEFCKWAVCYDTDGKNYDDRRPRTSIIALFHWPDAAEDFIKKVLPDATRDRFYVKRLEETIKLS